MDKNLIERIALEVVDEIYHGENQSWRKDGIIAVFADRFLARIDAERGKEAVGTLCISHFMNDPGMENMEFQPSKNLAPGQYQLFLSPTIQEGWPTDDMVVRGAETLHDSLRQSGCDHDFDADLRGTEIQQGIAESVFLSMIAAAKGERNAD